MGIHRFGTALAHGHRVLAAVPRWLGILRFVLFILPREHGLRRDQRGIGGGVPFVLWLVVVADVAEEREHLIIVLLRDRVEHVVVAAGAADGQAHECFRRRLEHVVESVEFREPFVVRFIVPHAESIKPGGDQAFVVHVRQLVPGNLLKHESVIRLVIIKGADDIVAVFPDEWLFVVALVAVGLCKTHDIEPMATPAFAVLRQAKQVLDQPRPGVGRVVVHERLHLVVGRRQADQVKVRAANQRGPIGNRVGDDALGFELCLNQLVDRRLTVALGQTRAFDGSKRPILAIFLRDGKPMLPLGSRCSWAAAWPRGAKPYPLLEIGHRLFAELLFRRHLQVGVGVLHRLDEQAFLGVSRRDGRAGVAAL